MKRSSKFLRVMLKMYMRSLKRSPHAAAISLMTLITLTLSTYISIDAWNNRGRYSKSTFTKWNEFQSKMAGRNIAANGVVQCEMNNIHYGNLQQEIKLIEAQFETGHYIEGNWYGIDLKSIPAIQAQFIADYGQLLGDQNVSKNFSHCQSVPCVISTFYNNDQEAGLLAYYWYLKTGSMLSMSNKIPGQDSPYAGSYANKKHLLEDYLFSKDELKNFFVLAKSLPEKFLHNPLLKSIHKLPNNSAIEFVNNGECSLSTPSGQILINQDCLGHQAELEPFLLKITAQMAKYVDLYEGRQKGHASLSSSQAWIDKSLWIQESYFDRNNLKFSNKWSSHMPQRQAVTADAKINPMKQFSELVANYRFNPARFTNSTPSDIQDYIKNNIFNQQSFDGNGLYKQYITSAVNEWSRSEVSLWADCFDQHLKPDALENSARDLASQVDNPLYSCVERKIPAFVQEVVTKIQSENFEGCKFFNDEIQYGHLNKQFSTVLNKFLQERILKRKIEFQNHGLEVLIGQSIKHEFISKIDPVSVYINCHQDNQIQNCYENRLTQEVNKLLNQNHKHLSDYYKKIIRDDVLQLYPFPVIAGKANEVAKKFIAPFYSKIHFTAKSLWNSCKDKRFSANDKIQLPLRFTGGKNFVNAGLLNCINSKIDKELYQIVNLKAFQELDEKLVEFKLNSREKDYALTFMQGKLVQILHNILEEEVELEKTKLALHFKEANQTIAQNIMKDKSFFEDVYSFSQIQNECLEKVQNHYPKKYFYKPTAELDKKFGRSICSTIIEEPEIKSTLSQKVQDRWQATQKTVTEYLDKHFNDMVDDCYSDYPEETGRNALRNNRMRRTCVEESFEIALNDAIVKWQKDKNFEHFSEREQEMANYLMTKRSDRLQKALKGIE
jgi:hypothetical protein